MDPATIALIVGLATLIIERAFTWAQRIKKSSCCGGTVELGAQ